MNYHRMLIALAWLLGTTAWSPLGAAPGELELQVVDQDSGEPVPVQMQLWNQKQRPVWPAKVMRDGNWMVFDGSTVLKLPPGSYQFRLQRGLEYRERTGHFELVSGAADNHQVELSRFVNMAQEGWWSGDLSVQPANWTGFAERVLAADLHMVPVSTWDNRRVMQLPTNASLVSEAVGQQRVITWQGGCDHRTGGIVWLFGAKRPLDLPAANADLPTPFEIARQLRELDQYQLPPHVHLDRTSHWDLPTWVALGALDSVGLLHSGLTEIGSALGDSDLPLDRVLFPPPDGVGRWTQELYFRLLNAGLRLPPGAGSGADVVASRLGHHRVYVHCGDHFSPAAWWDGLRAGRVVITNGPLLRPRVNGELPGHVFRATGDQRLELDVALQLSTQAKIQYLEIIQDGRSAQQVRLEDWVARRGQLPPVVFTSSGWMLIRAVADDSQAYRCGITGPYYVVFDDRPRISKQAVQFFLDWVYQRARRIDLVDAEQQRRVLEPQRIARDFWRNRLGQANAD